MSETLTQQDVDAWIGQFRVEETAVFVEQVHTPDVVAIGLVTVGGRGAFVTDQSGAIALAVLILRNAGVDARGVVAEGDIKRSALKRGRGGKR